jgi:hypothetical protein
MEIAPCRLIPVRRFSICAVLLLGLDCLARRKHYQHWWQFPFPQAADPSTGKRRLLPLSFSGAVTHWEALRCPLC